MKKLITISILALTINAFAQPYVKIPDAGFVNYLQAKIPAAMHSDSLNTSSPLVTTTTDSINVTAAFGVENLYGVQFFTSLKYLTCSGTGVMAAILTTLPPYFPTTLIYLDVNGGGITSIPNLPNGLTYLNCSNNNVTCFPNFPNSITTFNIDPNSYNCLPNYITAMNSTDLAMPLCVSGNSNGCPIASGASGIGQVKGSIQEISVYPNPSSGNFIIQTNIFTKQTVQVYNVSGKVVLSQIINSTTNIDATSLNEGVYSLTIKTVDSVINKKLVIVR